MDINKIIQTSEAMRNAIDELVSAFPNSVKILKSSKNNAGIISEIQFSVG